MTAKAIEVGKEYLVKVSGSVVPVRVTGMHEVWNGSSSRVVWDAVNTRTGRRIVVRSAQRFPARAEWSASNAVSVPGNE
jgi:hypothetical protein